MPEKAFVTVVGLKQLRAKLRTDEGGIFLPEWRAGLTALAAAAAEAGKGAAPKGHTGDLAASVSSRMAATSTISARVVVTAKHGGYNYGRLLEIAPKYHHVAWLLEAVKRTIAESAGILQGVARKIEARFGAA